VLRLRPPRRWPPDRQTLLLAEDIHRAEPDLLDLVEAARRGRARAGDARRNRAT